MKWEEDEVQVREIKLSVRARIGILIISVCAVLIGIYGLVYLK